MMRIGTVGISILIVIQSAAVHADTFRDAVEAAYCISVDQAEIDYYVQMIGLKNYPTEELESKISQRAAFVNNAVKVGLIDTGTVQKMKSAGYRESIACWKKVGACADGLKTFSEGQMAERENIKDDYVNRFRLPRCPGDQNRRQQARPGWCGRSRGGKVRLDQTPSESPLVNRMQRVDEYLSAAQRQSGCNTTVATSRHDVGFRSACQASLGEPC
jgi:hypothetical protein